MIGRIVKNVRIKSYAKDIARIDYSKLDNDISEVKDVCYSDAGHSECRLDIYYRSDGSRKPILIDIHGGGFISGDKEVNHLFGNYMSQRGFAVFNINYRLAYPEFTFFDQISDVAEAVSWVVKNASKYDADVSHLYIAGHSAGAVLALAECLLSLDKKMRTDFGLKNRDYSYKGILLDCGMLHMHKKSIAYWGMRRMVYPKGYQKTDWYRYLLFEKNETISKLPETILITNKADEVKEMTYFFKQLAEEENVSNMLFDEGTAGHMGIVFRPYTAENQEVIDRVFKYWTETRDTFS